MKTERFVLEYASAKKRALMKNEFMDPGIRAELIRRIEYAMKCRARGLITADEAVCMIGGFTTKDEDMSKYATGVVI